jgi:peroxiredoxin
MRNAIISIYISLKLLFVINFFVKPVFFVQTSYSYASSQGLDYEKINHNELDYTHANKQNANKILTFYMLKDKLMPPKLTFWDHDSQNRTLKDFRENLVILYFWATWCTECRPEIEAFKSMLDKLNYEDVTDVKLIAVSQDFKDKAQVLSFWREYGLDENNLFFDVKRELVNYFQVKSLPTAFIIDKTGHVIARINKPLTWDEELLYEEVKGLRQGIVMN